MKQDLTEKAYKEFKNKNYDYAYKLYNNMPSREINNIYSINKYICKKRIGEVCLPFFTILDEISHVNLSNYFYIFPLNIKRYENQIKKINFPIFLESCWHGNEDQWINAFISPGFQNLNAQHLLKVIELSKKYKRKIIFWNKEDPMHYSKFLQIAKLCDIVLTTDINMIKNYKKDCNNSIIDVMQFAANQYIFNPINKHNMNSYETICFAGSYYTTNHESRKKQMDDILPIIIDMNGVIYDRFSNLNNKLYSFPDKYTKYIRNSIPFALINNIYKKSKFFLNVNTITDSPTMMSRRVYEILACGTPVISTPSLAIEEQFDSIVQIAHNAKAASNIINDLMSNKFKWDRISHIGYREVMTKHTYGHRLKKINELLSIEIPDSEQKVSIIMASKRPHFIDRIINNIKSQTYKKKELIICIQNYDRYEEDLLRNRLSGIDDEFTYKVIRDDSQNSLGYRYNNIIRYASGNYLAKMDDDDFYFKNYIADMFLPFSFTNADLVGKKEIFIYLEGEDKTIHRFKNERHKFTDFVCGPTLFFKKELFDSIKFKDLNNGEDSEFLKDCKKKGYLVYSSDPFNFIQFRSKDINAHTWRVDNNFFQNSSEIVSKGISSHICEI